MSIPELKKCPFCGHYAHIMRLKQSVSPRFYVVCGNGYDRCIASGHYIFGSFYYSMQDAADAWNRRASDENNDV